MLVIIIIIGVGVPLVLQVADLLVVVLNRQPLKLRIQRLKALAPRVVISGIEGP